MTRTTLLALTKPLVSLFATLTVVAVLNFSAHGAEPTRKGLDYFEAKIRPMLVTHCYQCHSAGAAAKKNLKAELYLDTREGALKGGESGPAVVPGKPAESLLLKALKHDGFEMPPKGKLPDELITHFEKWITMGAPDPREGSNGPVTSGVDIAAGKKHWAFQPLKEVAVPQAKDTAWVRNSIDQFIRSRQEAAGVLPNQSADPLTLVRRAYFDLTGLPPTPAQIDEFLKLAKQDLNAAYGKLVDQLLSSERFGERWARHWLDLVRFAESNGYAFDKDRGNAFRYRDFVIRAINEDMPYNEFVRWQVAGDLLANPNPQTAAEAADAIEKLAATGFLVAGPFTTQQTQKERERSRYEQLDDVINTLGTSMLGLTIGCCRCHNHKYDPLPQYDYYRFASCFAEVGFSDTGINMQPAEFKKTKAAFDAVHNPLVATLTKFEKEELPGRFDQWFNNRPADQPSVPGTLKLENWRHVGPFSAADQTAAYNEKFPPEEKVDLAATYLDGKLKWVEKPGWVDGTVHNTLTGDNSANYLFRIVESPEQQQLALSLGSDDAIKVWVNGKEVLGKNVGGAATADQYSANVTFNKGKNEVLLKIVNGGGPSGFYFSTGAAGTPIALPAMSDWQQVGPFAAKDLNVAFNTAFAPESGVNLTKTYEGDKLKWTAQPQWKDDVAHNDKLQGTNCANYLYRTIDAEQPTDVALSLGSDDAIKVWLNGNEVLAKKVTRNNAAANQEKLNIKVPAGRSELLIKIVNGAKTSGYYFGATAVLPPKDVVAFLKLDPAKLNAGQKQKIVNWFKGFDGDWIKYSKQVTASKTKEPKPQMTTAYAAKTRGSSYQFGGDTFKVYHLRRGNADNKTEEAKPGVLQVLVSTEQKTTKWFAESEEKKTPPRVALADWLSDTNDGAGHLLARVIVNRVWSHHFGRGLVATPSDFGTRGDRPSHPDLLDWLAQELIRNNWKLKPIHKLIMNSSTYMQANGNSETGLQKDPDNLLIWRRNSRRLEAEAIRDSLIAISGELDTTLYGKGTLDQNTKRRSVYFTVKRSQLIPLLQLFGAPDTMQGIASRQESTVAPQALAMMNSAFVRGIATKLAQRVKPNAETTIEQAIDDAYRAAFSRPARDEEITRLVEFVKQQTERRGAGGEALALRDACHLLLCANEFLYVD
jgi:hypothetical protein